jgi:hypothetical protein
MAEESFKDIKWTVPSTNENEPADWNESSLIFFSNFFIQFLQEEGKVEHFCTVPIL